MLRHVVWFVIFQSISAQCIGAYGAYGYDGFGYGGFGYDGFGYDGYGYGAPFAACAGPYGYGPAGLAASNGPGLAVSSASPLIPAGVSVVSENAYEGALAVGGAVPFLGTVALEGALPTAGAGAIAYGCGNGAVAITAEDAGAYGYGLAGPYGYAGIAEPFGYGYGLAGPLGYGPGYAGCGCGAFY
ncbi:chorion class B protein PC10-like [Epargyreus clarus]|uniref:chorion class B protein PC10-like n=1 Tax=Epargyreus clarus TaxID=520877 RepID=UPI003C2CF5D8